MERAKNYFRRPGFRRLLEEVWKKYERLERVGGHASILQATPQECEAINEFFGWNYRSGDTIKVPLVLFEEELAGSAFPLTLHELHEVMEGKPIRTKSEHDQLKQETWRQLFVQVRERLNRFGYGQAEELLTWLERLEQGIGAGCRTLRELTRVSPPDALSALTDASRAYGFVLTVGSGTLHLPAIRLPVLAAAVTGDAHALDRDRSAGRLLYHAFRDRMSGDKPADLYSGSIGTDLSTGTEEMELPEESAGFSILEDTLRIRQIYRSAGIADDDLSSIVHLYAWDTKETYVPMIYTLRQVEVLKPEALPVGSDLYVVENPAVFSTLLDVTESLGSRAGYSSTDMPPVLLCTSGPASAAALRLMDKLIEHGKIQGNIYYSGDFDVRGLEMGIVMAGRYGAHMRPWRFDGATYAETVAEKSAGPGFSPYEMERLRNMNVPWDARLPEVMIECGRRVFQETIMGELSRDWIYVI